jgi:hypothetical protein
MFSAGVIAESQSSSVKVLMAVQTSKVGAAQYGAATEPLEGQGGSFSRIGTIQEYTAARANANFSSGSDHQPLDIMIKGNLYRCTSIMNRNDIAAVGVHLFLTSTNSTFLSKSDIAGISTDLGFLPSSGANFQTTTDSTVCEPVVNGVVHYHNKWSWDTYTSSSIGNPNVIKPYDNILGFVSGAVKTVEIIL